MTCPSPGSTEICGGSNALSVSYNAAVAVLASSASVASVLSASAASASSASVARTSLTPAVPTGAVAGGYSYINAYTDNANGVRVLANQQQLLSTTVETCVKACTQAGYGYAGVEYGSECWCDSSIHGNPTTASPSMACQGNGAEYCGGPNVIQVYQGTPSPTYLTAPVTNGQCVTDNSNGARLLTGAVFNNVTMTPAVCKTDCIGFTYYGVEYGRECYCGNSFPSGIPVSTACTITCAGDSTQICGGGNALNIYNS